MYVIIIVAHKEDVKPAVVFDDLKIEYITIGSQFVGRHFKGNRPTHVIDYTKTLKWFDYLKEQTPSAKRVIIE